AQGRPTPAPRPAGWGRRGAALPALPSRPPPPRPSPPPPPRWPRGRPPRPPAPASAPLPPLVDPDADAGVLVVDAHDVAAPLLEPGERGPDVELVAAGGEERVDHVDGDLHPHRLAMGRLVHVDGDDVAGAGDADRLVVLLHRRE